MIFLKRSRYDWNYTSEYDKYTEKCYRNPSFEMSFGTMLEDRVLSATTTMEEDIPKITVLGQQQPVMIFGNEKTFFLTKE